MKGRILPNGDGSRESGKASSAAVSRPITNPINPEKSVSAARRPNKAFRPRIGRVVIYGVITSPKRAPIRLTTSVYMSCRLGLNRPSQLPQ